MSLPGIINATLVEANSPRTGQATQRIALFTASGSPHVVPAQAAAQTDAPALTSVVAAGANPTKAEYDALRADVSALRTTVNSLLAKLRTAGVVDT